MEPGAHLAAVEVAANHQQLECGETRDPHGRRAAEDWQKRPSDHRLKRKGHERSKEDRKDQLFSHVDYLSVKSARVRSA